METTKLSYDEIEIMQISLQEYLKKIESDGSPENAINLALGREAADRTITKNRLVFNEKLKSLGSDFDRIYEEELWFDKYYGTVKEIVSAYFKIQELKDKADW